MTADEWCDQQDVFKDLSAAKSRISVLESALREARDRALKISEAAQKLYDKDSAEYMAAPAGNPGNCWEAPSRHLQSFSWIRDSSSEVVAAIDLVLEEK